MAALASCSVRAAAPLTNLFSFAGGTNGASPQGRLFAGLDGNFYGVTSTNGTNGGGTVFRIAPSGVLTTLFSFASSGADGRGFNPQGGLFQAADSNFYGTASSGGTNAAGTIFKITTNGSFTVLRSLAATNGTSPRAALMQGLDGSLYGTMSTGGVNSGGTIFRTTTAGILTLLRPLTTTNDGWIPIGGLVQNSADSNFFGTTSSGGTNNLGTVFAISPTGNFSTICKFIGGTNGANPQSTPVLGGDGFLYGSTELGGTAASGTVFKIATNGTLAWQRALNGAGDGGLPGEGLIAGRDGFFYGTTAAGGTNLGGTIFRIATNAALVTLCSFNPTTNGAGPHGIAFGADGNIYGTTSGTNANIFRLSGFAPFVIVPPPDLALAVSTTGRVAVTAGGSTPLSYQWQKGGTNLSDGGSVSDSTTNPLVLSLVTANDAGSYRVVITNIYGSVTSVAATVQVGYNPVITDQPQSLIVTSGTPAVFSTAATGSVPLIYQWQKGGINLTNGGTLSGISSNILTISSTTTTDAGNYRVIITNIFGIATSSVATLTVAVVPAIIIPPQSQVVTNGWPARLNVGATGTSPLYYQWRKNGANMTNGGTISGVTSTNLLFSPVSTNDTANYDVVVTNIYNATTSSIATLTVALDTNRPVVARVFNIGPTNVQLVFSEPLYVSNATNSANYSFTNGGIIVSACSVNSSSTTVTLTTSPLNYGSNYCIALTNIFDAATPSNSLASPLVSFVALPYTPAEIGNPAITSAVTFVSSNGFDVTAAGSDIRDMSDQFSLWWQQVTGDFDVKVRVASLGLVDAWSRAGLMARADLQTNSAFAASFATPTIAGCYFEYRATNNSTAVMSGSAPVNYPNTWLRLQRATNTFYSYASMDGANWQFMGSVAITSMPAACYLGIAVSSHQTNLTTTVQFRDFTDATGSGLGTFVQKYEPLGPSSRRCGLAISEIMYAPKPRVDGKNLEFVEIFNSQSIAEDMSGYRLSGGISYTFATGTVLAAGAFLVVAKVPADIIAVYGLTSNLFGPYTGSLSDNGDTIRLRNELDAVYLDVTYNNKLPWPVASAGAGHSLVLARASYGEADPRAWAASDTIGGSPGAWNPVTTDPLDGVVINEYLAHTDPPLNDYIELYNHSNSPKDLSGAWLSNNALTNKFRIPDGTIIPARGFVCYIDTQLGFRLNKDGDQIFLVNSNQTRVIDAVNFEGQENPVSSGRIPDGGPDFYRLAALTPGTNNGAIRQESVVINELMYAPISGDDNDQYVELYNRASSNIDLSGWSFTSGITFTIPTNTTIPSHGYLVIAANAAHLRSNYANLGTANCIGDWQGKLGHSGDRIAFGLPHTSIVTNGTVVGPYTFYIPVTEVTYEKGGRWGDWSDAGGSSLELIDPDANTRLPDNWADSDESNKTSQWVIVNCTQNLGETVGSPINDNLHVYLLGMGECLVDDVEVVTTNSITNLVVNGSFESGITGWTPQGAFDQSTVEAGGYTGAQCLHVRGSTRGDVGANRIRSPSFTPMTNGAVTFRCKAKWVRGWPELLLRLHGGSMEVPIYLPPPSNLGSPGLPNSRYVTNAGPAIFNVKFSPVFPAMNQAVVVTAQTDDPEGVTNLTLNYRIDPSATYSIVTMTDDGTGADGIAGDGVFSATIPGQSTTNVIAFFVRGVDSLGASNNFPRVLFPQAVNPPRMFPSDALSHECLVRWGEMQMSGSFATYHMWMTKANHDRWTNRAALNNAAVDGTFVYNNYRVVMNAGMMFSGSPYHAGQMTSGPDGGNRCDYICNMPVDDLVLGESGFIFALPGNGSGGDSNDHSSMAEQMSFQVFRKLGLTANYRRYMHVFFNGSQRSTITGVTGSFIYEDPQQPNGEFLNEWFFSSPSGQLHKIEDWFEFNDAATGFSNNDADMQRRIIPGTTSINPAPYRFMWRLRSVNPGESASDYTNFYKMVNVVAPTINNSTDPFNYPLVNNVCDVEQWFREFACERMVGNYDSYGWNRGKNNFLYFVPGGRATILTWDVDWTMGLSGGQPPNASIYGSNDQRITAAQKSAPVLRHYMQAFRDILDGPWRAGYLDGLMDERAAALTANGVNYKVADINTQKWYIIQRRAYIESQVATIQTNFAIINPTNSILANNYLVLTGYAPIELSTLTINGQTQQITWVTSNKWSASVALVSGSNTLNFAGYDRHGTALTNSIASMNYFVTSTNDPPAGEVVFNEILASPLVTDSGFVELFNTSSNTAFDMSGWDVSGIGYTFPSGSVIGPNGYLLLAKDRIAYASAFGTNTVPFNVFSGNISSNGETLSLTIPGPSATTIVSRVRYETVSPWPVITNGASLQLIDATNDISRVSNWDAGRTNSPVQSQPQPQWVYFAATGTFSSTTLYIYLQTAGDIYVDDMRCVTGSIDSGTSYVTNGDFESALSGPWSFAGGNFTGSAISTNFRHAGGASLHVVATAGGTGSGNAILETLASSWSGSTVISFWYLQNTNGGPITVRLSGNGTVATANPNMPASSNTVYVGGYQTPGTTNASRTSLPVYPSLWLNEVQASNISVSVDNAGEHEPWVELFNTGTGTVSLAGLYLSDNYTNLTQWAFPTNATMSSNSFRIVWCDGQTNQTTTNALHSNFRIPPGAGRVALSRMITGTPQIVDYLNYTNLPDNWSYGDIPDGQPFYRRLMYVATPAATNNGAALPATVAINEWMADNKSTITNPVNGKKDDWFELYNFGPTNVDLGGFYLTDNFAAPDQFMIPTNTILAAYGFLLVWADGTTNQNGGDLHVPFNLAKGGEEIGLYSPSKIAVDTVTFGAQQTDVSQGRWTDGDPHIYTMAVPTPRTNNIVSTNNAPPVFTNSPPWHADEMTDFVIVDSAADTDAPPQRIVYAMSGAPPGAALDTNSGTFAWSPAEADGPGTNIFIITATDNGWPPRTATQLVTLIVGEVNRAPQPGVAPVLATYPGSISSVLLPAGDPDIPANTLVFSLDAGAPAGAGVEPASGLVTWQPSYADADSVVTVRVVIADNGVPPLSATGAAIFAVGPVTNLFDTTIGGEAQIIWNAQSGANYRVEFSDDLAASLWRLLTNQAATNSGPVTLPDPAATNALRFYRVLWSP